jgi:glucose-6-phosphate isomerase
MKPIQISTKFADSHIDPQSLSSFQSKVKESQSKLLKDKHEFGGWIHLPSQITPSLIDEIEKISQEIQSSGSILVVVGIGGSYLGTRAILESMGNPLFSDGSTEVIYAGHHLDTSYYIHLLDYLKEKDFYINVVSKSGTTTEPAVAFRFLLELAEKKYGKKANQRIIATTDASKGALFDFATKMGFRKFVIPDDVGGRYSFLTPVGLLPISVGGVSIRELWEGAKFAEEYCQKDDSWPIQYAALRNYFLSKGKSIELLASFQSQLKYLMEWWKQLFGESEGKSGKGIFPASVEFTTDLHSMGQYIQDGQRILFETMLSFQDSISMTVPKRDDDIEGLNYLAGRPLFEINEIAKKATLLAHSDGGVPCLEIQCSGLSPFVLGELMYSFEFACAISGFTLGVDPFDQPGVEDYKKNMFALLGKKGFEGLKKEIDSRLK